jgi:Na+-transporting NADH:ubiquinone oxidoreductase subunit NqrC
MSDATVIQIVNVVVALVGTMFTGTVAYLMARMRYEQEARAAEQRQQQILMALRVREVKETAHEVAEKADGKLDALATVAAATHVLVNNDMGTQLRETMEARREVALLAPTTENLRKAETAALRYADHAGKQAVVDALPGTDEAKAGRHGTIERPPAP